MPDNCQIPTPSEYVKAMLDYAGYKKNLFGKRILENSCGEGNILCEIVRRYIEDAIASGYSRADIVTGLERDIEAYEIKKKTADVCVSRLNCIVKEYDLYPVKWNIHVDDYLKSGTKKYAYIIGNPPYITHHDMSVVCRKYLKSHYESCKKGRFDYCYAFIEKSVRELEPEGVLTYLVPYSVLKNKYAADLRNTILPYVTSIYDYSGIKVFPEAITSSIILVCRNRKNVEQIHYSALKKGIEQDFLRYALNEKWSYKTEEKKEKRFDDYFEVCNSVATLCNEAFLLHDYEEKEHYYLSEGCEIEKEVVFPAISTKSINKSIKNVGKQELIIFPYQYRKGKIIHMNAKEFMEKYPGAYQYLKGYGDKLKQRKKDRNAEWFEYGRSQAITRVFGRKLVMPMVITGSVNVNYGKCKEIPYAGYFIRCRRGSKYGLKDAKRILESKDFLEYVMREGTPTTPSSYRISVNDIKKYEFSEDMNGKDSI